MVNKGKKKLVFIQTELTISRSEGLVSTSSKYKKRGKGTKHPSTSEVVLGLDPSLRVTGTHFFSVFAFVDFCVSGSGYPLPRRPSPSTCRVPGTHPSSGVRTFDSLPSRGDIPPVFPMDGDERPNPDWDRRGDLGWSVSGHYGCLSGIDSPDSDVSHRTEDGGTPDLWKTRGPFRSIHDSVLTSTWVTTGNPQTSPKGVVERRKGTMTRPTP